MRSPTTLGCFKYFFPKKAETTPIMNEQIKFKILTVLDAQCFFICCSKISVERSDYLVSRRLGDFSRFCIGSLKVGLIIIARIVIRGYKKLLIKQFIANNFISSHMTDRTNRKPMPAKIYQYDDWTCLMCQNLNYSFRKTCNDLPNIGNRCRVQTKENNDYLLELYHASVYLAMT